LDQIALLSNFYLCYLDGLCFASLLLPFLIHLVRGHEEQNNTVCSQFITSRSDTVPLVYNIKYLYFYKLFSDMYCWYVRQLLICKNDTHLLTEI
jgi:hypothetical protein